MSEEAVAPVRLDRVNGPHTEQQRERLMESLEWDDEAGIATTYAVMELIAIQSWIASTSVVSKGESDVS
jgi:hypothetical protein